MRTSAIADGAAAVAEREEAAVAARPGREARRAAGDEPALLAGLEDLRERALAQVAQERLVVESAAAAGHVEVVIDADVVGRADAGEGAGGVEPAAGVLDGVHKAADGREAMTPAALVPDPPRVHEEVAELLGRDEQIVLARGAALAVDGVELHAEVLAALGRDLVGRGQELPRAAEGGPGDHEDRPGRDPLRGQGEVAASPALVGVGAVGQPASPGERVERGGNTIRPEVLQMHSHRNRV